MMFSAKRVTTKLHALQRSHNACTRLSFNYPQSKQSPHLITSHFTLFATIEFFLNSWKTHRTIVSTCLCVTSQNTSMTSVNGRRLVHWHTFEYLISTLMWKLFSARMELSRTKTRILRTTCFHRAVRIFWLFYRYFMQWKYELSGRSIPLCSGAVPLVD